MDLALSKRIITFETMSRSSWTSQANEFEFSRSKILKLIWYFAHLFVTLHRSCGRRPRDTMQNEMKISKIWFADDRIYGLTDDGRELWQKQDNNFIAPPSDYGRWGFFCAYLSL